MSEATDSNATESGSGYRWIGQSMIITPHNRPYVELHISSLLWCVSFYVESRDHVFDHKGFGRAELHIKSGLIGEGRDSWAPRVALAMSQRAKPLEQSAVLLPGRDVRKGGVVGNARKGLALHLEVRPGVDLGRQDMLVAEEVPDDLQRHAGL